MTSSAKVLVLGGGPAGCAAAITLARGGLEVTLVERDPGPKHKVCGEFLSHEALAILPGLGVDAGALGAVPIRGVRFCSGEHISTAELPFPAMSLSRKVLDEALLARVAGNGATVLAGTPVQSLERQGSLWCARLGDGRELHAGTVVLATGKHDLRGWSRPAGAQNNLLALKMYLRLSPAQFRALGSHVELLLYRGGYAGLQPVADGVTNLSCLVQRSVLSAAGGGWEGLLALLHTGNAHARERLADAAPLLERALAVAAIPYGFVRKAPLGEALWAVGDQAAVIPSFTGDGMSIALMSGVRAAEGLLRGEDATAFQRTLHRDLCGQVARATAISRGLVWEPSKRAISAAVRLWPGLLRGTAAATRLSSASLAGVKLAGAE